MSVVSLEGSRKGATLRRLADGRTIEAHRNHNIRKRCGCPRRQWNRCAHDWHFNFKYGNQKPYRFSLNVFLCRTSLTREEATAEADRIRSAIRAGTFTLKVASPVEQQQRTSLTFLDYGAIFVKLCPKRRGKNKGKVRDDKDASTLKQLAALPGADGKPLGPRSIEDVTLADLESAFASLRAKGRAASTRNKYLEMARMLSAWGVRKGYLARPWIVSLEDTDLSREKGSQRARRLEEGEEARILAQASPWLQRLILAALETGCRQGELLALQWQDVSNGRHEFTVRDSKTGASRTLPMSPTFAALIAMVRRGPEDREQPPTAYVFGDGLGRRVRFPQKTWECAVLKAHGHKPTWTERKALGPASRAALHRIDLTFHDLRHEAGSRMLEAGWPLHHIQMMLGHANLSQTSTYLNASRTGLHDSMRRFGTTSATPLHPVAPATTTGHAPPCKDEAGDSPQVTVN